MQSLPTFDLVLFGGTGDLAMRKLLPALYRRSCAGQIDGRVPHHRRGAQPAVARGVPGAGARKLPDARRQRLRRRRNGRNLPSASQYVQDRRTDRRRLCTARRGVARAARSTCACSSFRPRRTCSRRSARAWHGIRWSRRPRASCWRSRWVTTAPRRRRSTSASASMFSRAADLSHRSLSRQGDGAEPAGAALRQYAVRAAVAPRPRPARADHRRRGTRRRAARRSSTIRPARCATWCRTTCCSCCASSRWSRRPPAMRMRCATRS